MEQHSASARRSPVETEAGWESAVRSSVDTYGTPAYVYRPSLIRERIAQLNDVLSAKFALRYAVKTNPNPWLLKWLHPQIDSLDVSSAGEISLAVSSAWPAQALAFTGPAKSEQELKFAVETGVGRIVLESLDEAQLLNRIAGKKGVSQNVLVRIAPQLAERGFAVRLAGRPTQFGVDEELLAGFLTEMSKLSSLSLVGFHVYSGSQCLDGEALAEHFLQTWQVFRRAIEQWDRPVSELVFGAGMGIPYHEGETSLDLMPLTAAAGEVYRQVMQVKGLVDPKLKLESGRFLVGEAGVYVVRVVRIKETRGTTIAICDGGMNHNLGACGHLGGVSHRHYRISAVGKAAAEPTKNYRLVGPLCTTIDTLAHRIQLPELCQGDLLAIKCGGAYGPSASPLFFISHRHPKEIALIEDDEVVRPVDISWLPDYASRAQR